MGKEMGKAQDQGPFAQTILDLEAKNREFNGMLFATFKTGREKTLIFPTPSSRIIGNIDIDGSLTIVDEFLVITLDGPKAIQVSTENSGFARAEVIENLINKRLGKKPGFFSGTGYVRDWDGGTVNIARGLGGGLFISKDKTTRFYRDVRHDYNCRLVEIDKDRVEKLLQANIERAQRIKASSRKVSEVLSKAS